MDNNDFFEGQEKLLEVWFKPPNSTITPGKHPHRDDAQGLRAIPRARVEGILDEAKCCILDAFHGDFMDSYVLSESSLFITAYRIILKTCGTTRLLPALPLIVQAAADVGLTEIDDMFFSRREFIAPHTQEFPHRDFREEVAYLDQYFDGVAYPLGRLNGDRWYLYTLNNQLHITCPDVTVEIMMTSLDRTAMNAFYKSTLTAREVTQQSGIADIVPGAHIHEFLFDPCGYSCNAVFGEFYFTIHVTPQEEFSYVSFETDVLKEDYTPMILKVLDIFKPGKFSINVFANEHAPFGNAQNAFNIQQVQGAGFQRHDQQLCCLAHASVLFGHFTSNTHTAIEDAEQHQRRQRVPGYKALVATPPPAAA
ncbi:adenosylmethionine decarboxylase 1 isoform 2 [Salpingoeca rosetta]|uniref:S-adenosylmethionine decarboxylase proenzyme n=1 Tax=Salpingoeca rosetta (strain ATCC 50818 / BSB-021) TaxID=946362 RepID=F2UJ25_SALR5|nr:adenosylmethionine decarboxylase 1 isoform 2 [Salpingoeca rosetta]EGD76973.1 adenosylmethionine decarboxylase 1 isoform 2 [Salpingoeca rosetta]|eukprot:XP_004990813.1 adenosylmethionine decarboxylase 1 isoform 2 [Salpingoeca rosetta]